MKMATTTRPQNKLNRRVRDRQRGHGPSFGHTSGLVVDDRADPGMSSVLKLRSGHKMGRCPEVETWGRDGIFNIMCVECVSEH